MSISATLINNKPQLPITMSLLSRTILATTLTSITILTGTILASNTVSADDNTSVVDQINITVPIACTISGTGMNTHNANINNGLYEDDIGSTTLHAFCNDAEGFAIYAAGYTGDEVGGTNSNKLVGTSSSGNATIESGIATSAGNPDVSNWAMKLAITQDSGDTTGTNAFTIDSAPNVALPSEAEQSATSTSFSSYHVVPNEYTKVAHKDSNTDMTTNTGGVKLTTTYAAYISKTQPADTYSGQVIYILVHPAAAEPDTSTSNCEPGHICYDVNVDSSEIEGAMDTQALIKAKDWSSCNSFTDYATTCIINGLPIDINTLPELDSYADLTLQASNFKREGYGFAGWNDKADISGTNYGPNQTIPVTQDIIDNGITFYAHWVESTGNLQGWNGCSTLNTNQVVGLTDTRDNNVYAVSKLADGNCWMIENLRLADKDNNNNPITLNSTNTNNPAPNFTALSATSNDWCSGINETCINQNNLNTDNIISFTANTTGSQGSDIYSYGNYYNWYTATAGTGTYSQASGNAPGDICPNGWSLPTGENDGQFSVLDISMGGTSSSQITAEASNRWRSYPNNFLYSGEFSGSSTSGRGSRGGYWSSSATGNTVGSFQMQLNISSVGVTYANYRVFGNSIRCVTNS